jgi:glycosyltransferase involved in cell wall biosynthesis
MKAMEDRKGRISTCIITYNEEENIRDCIESVLWTDEIVLVDSRSTDRTVEIARTYTDRIFIKDWDGFVGQKNFAASQCSYPWILSLDADERVSPELKMEIQCLFKNGREPDEDGFLIPRHTFYLGRWINHGGWYPDHQLRLFRRDKGRWEGEGIHERVVISGKKGYLRGDIIHYTYRNISHQLKTIDRFSDISVNLWLNKGKRPNFVGFLFHPAVKFFETYIYKGGFLDGIPGLIIAMASSFYIFVKYAKLWEKKILRSR